MEAAHLCGLAQQRQEHRRQPDVAKLHQEITAIQDSAEAQKQFANEGADIIRMSSAGFGDFIASELTKWGRVVKEAGIKPE